MKKVYAKQKIVDLTLLIAAFLSVITLIVLYGFDINKFWSVVIIKFQLFFAAMFTSGFIFRVLRSNISSNLFVRKTLRIILLSIFGLFILYLIKNIFGISPVFILNKENLSGKLVNTILLHVYIVAASFIIISKFRDIWLIFSLKASRILILSFFFVIVSGALLLKLPNANNGLSWIDAFFTSTSAVCVTGLSTVDIPTVLTFQGQVILMVLIQIGGLGIVTITTFVALFLQKGFRLKDQVLLSQIMDDEVISSMSATLIKIILITFTVEFAGAALLYFSWAHLGFDEFDRIFYALFHSVSAYCNAGFSNYKTGMESYEFFNSFPTLITIMLLIILGGIGFYTFLYLFSPRRKFINQGLKLQTKIIIISTLVLIFFGALLVWLLQYNEWKHLPVGEQILNSFFLSITSRTAGFSNVNIGIVLHTTLLVVIFLMYIGAAPNSTAGGIKITTFVSLFYGVWAFIRGRVRVEIGWNTLNIIVVRRALIVFLISITLISVSFFALSISENLFALGKKQIPIFDLFFETVSAFGTVGLSTGITPFLSGFAKLVLILMMYFGRVGLFTLAIAIGEEKYHAKYKYPETNIMVG